MLKKLHKYTKRCEEVERTYVQGPKLRFSTWKVWLFTIILLIIIVWIQLAIAAIHTLSNEIYFSMFVKVFSFKVKSFKTFVTQTFDNFTLLSKILKN